MVCVAVGPNMAPAFPMQQSPMLWFTPSPFGADMLSYTCANVAFGVGQPLASGFGDYVARGQAPPQVLMDIQMPEQHTEQAWAGQLQSDMRTFWTSEQAPGQAQMGVHDQADDHAAVQDPMLSDAVEEVMPCAPADCAASETLRRRWHSYETELDLADDTHATNARCHAEEEPWGVEEEPEPTTDDTRARAMADALLKQLKLGGMSEASAAARFMRLAFSNKASSRAAQLAIEGVTGNDAAVLASGLHGHVRDAIRSIYANYVVQKAVEILPPSCISFIPQELLGVGQEVARHRCGCRILCRLLEHGSLRDSSVAALFDEVLGDTEALSRHTYGNYVIRHCLEYGLPEHRQWISQALCSDLLVTSRHRYGSRVVQTALQFCTGGDRSALFSGLLASSAGLIDLARGLSGRHVVKALLKIPGEHQKQAASRLRPARAHLEMSKYGKPVVDALRSIPE